MSTPKKRENDEEVRSFVESEFQEARKANRLPARSGRGNWAWKPPQRRRKEKKS